jgi:hypothetical protein
LSIRQFASLATLPQARSSGGRPVFISARADACLTSVKPMATFTHRRIVTRRKLLRVVEIAEILGVSKQRADQLRGEPDFPAPIDRWARGDLWTALGLSTVGADLYRRRGVVGSTLLAAARQPLLPLSNHTVTVPRKARRYRP